LFVCFCLFFIRKEMKFALCVVVLFFALAAAKTFYKEEFGAGWESRWVQSKHKSDLGKFVASHGKFFDDAERDTGLKTSEDARFYAIASAIEPSFSNKGKTLVIQFTVKHEQGLDCGGGYLKIGPKFDLATFHGETNYNLMFGPDICGSSKRTHLIFNYKGKNHLKRTDIRTESDEGTHLYTLVVKPDQTYEVLIDQKSAASGNLLDDFDFLPPREIEDPKVSKPSDWVENPTMDDPEDQKPQGWEDIPQFVADPEAEKPDDWDDEEDGEWEPPTVPNPEYKGEWKPKQIPNPAYKGPWVHPKIANPEFHEDNEIYAYSDFGFVGIDIWQVKSGSIFDNILITDNLDEANAHAAETFELLAAKEKHLLDADKEEKRKVADAERAKRDAEMKEIDDDADSTDDHEGHHHDDL